MNNEELKVCRDAFECEMRESSSQFTLDRPDGKNYIEGVVNTIWKYWQIAWGYNQDIIESGKACYCGSYEFYWGKKSPLVGEQSRSAVQGDDCKKAFEEWWSLPEHALAYDFSSDKWLAEKAYQAAWNHQQAKIDELQDVIEKVIADYEGLCATAKKYSLYGTLKDAAETIDYLKQALAKLKGE
jgi:hypothetical protein